MEYRELAHKILSSSSLDDKLTSPKTLTDNVPGDVFLYKEPARSIGMDFKPHSYKDKLPPLEQLKHSDNRAICLHRFAGHELLAVEIMAYALLAYPNAPKNFRKGLLNTLLDEQRHVKLYLKAMEPLGIKLGDLPLYKHFWSYTPYLKTPLEYLSVMSLTLEMANLDFAPLYGSYFDRYGDTTSSNLMKIILKDEIRHVRFGYVYLKKFMKKDEVTPYETWLNSIPEMLSPRNALGRRFQKENRKKAGIDEEWINKLSTFVKK